MQRCPNCGAYVMSDDNICPRCDHPLNQHPVTEVFDLNKITPAPMNHTAPETKSAAESSSPEDDRANLPTTRLPHAVPIFSRAEPDERTEIWAAPTPDDEEHTEMMDRPAPADELMMAADDESPIWAAPEPDIRNDVEQEVADSLVADLEQEVVSLVPAEEPPAPEDLPEALPADSWFAASTQPRLQDQLSLPSLPSLPAEEELPSELPTAKFASGEQISDTAAHRQDAPPAFLIPPAPYTPPPTPLPPPPASITPPPAFYGYMQPVYAAPSFSSTSSAAAYLQQRVQAYRRSGYHLHVHAPYEATLSYGKSLGVGGWLLALFSISGLFWYLLLLALSGFQRDIVDIVLESDGQVYEDGPGAAFIRRQRSRVGRRWAMFGAAIFVVSLLLGIALAVVAGITLRNERYQAALREAYPAVTLFEEQFSATEANPEDVGLAKDGAVAYAIVAGIALVGLWGGVTLWVIGTIHARAYRVQVSPLPGWE